MYTPPLNGILHQEPVPSMNPEGLLIDEQERLEKQYPTQKNKIQVQTDALQRLVRQCRDKGIANHKITELLRDKKNERESELDDKRTALTSAESSSKINRLALRSQLKPNSDAPNIILRFPNEQKLAKCLNEHPCTKISYFQEKGITKSVVKSLANEEKVWLGVQNDIIFNEKIQSPVVGLNFIEAVADCAETIEEKIE